MTKHLKAAFLRKQEPSCRTRRAKSAKAPASAGARGGSKRHPGESRGPGVQARALPVALGFGLRRNDDTSQSRVPAKAGTFLPHPPCKIREGSCFRRSTVHVTPAKAGVQEQQAHPLPVALDSGFRRNDETSQSRVPAKAGTFLPHSPCEIRERSCCRRSAAHVGASPRRKPGSRGSRHAPCRWPWIPASAGMTTLPNAVFLRKQEPSCRTHRANSAKAPAAAGARSTSKRHPGESRGPGATGTPSAGGPGFRLPPE